MAHDDVHGLGNVNLLLLACAVQYHHDVAPVVAPCIVFQTEGYHALRRIQELQMLTHQMSIAQAESRMMTTQADQVAIVLEHLRIAFLVLPAQTVDAIGRLKRVVNALLGTQQLLTAEHERYAL